MEITIRQLQQDDLHHVKSMETGIVDDYLIRVYNRVSKGASRLYGLFVDNHLASIGGYTIFEEHYIMLGRMRSDLRFRGQNYSTQLMTHILKQSFALPAIQWVGANTQQNNHSARRVLDKLGLNEISTLSSAISTDVQFFEKDQTMWHELTELVHKRKWLKQCYLKSGAVFPYECYYTFPATDRLFSDTNLNNWSFFENPQKDRVLITKKDVKGDYYLHVIYPWDDLTEQPGLWETVSCAQHALRQRVNANTFIWMDLTPAQVSTLPRDHPFELPSPWLLYGIDRNSYSF